MTVALLDANVLYPQYLRDTLVQLATDRVFSARWTNQIHEEWTRNLLQNHPELMRPKLEYSRFLMEEYNPAANVSGYESLIETLQLPDTDDRHILAAAIRAQAQFIVTFNLKDFPNSVLQPHSLRALSPDEFLTDLLAAQSESVLDSLAKQRARLQNPPKSANEFLQTLARQGLPKFVAALESHQSEI